MILNSTQQEYKRVNRALDTYSHLVHACIMFVIKAIVQSAVTSCVTFKGVNPHCSNDAEEGLRILQEILLQGLEV